jgi:hypothetical protein
LRSNFEALRDLSCNEKQEMFPSSKRKEKDDDDAIQQAKKYRLAVETALAVEDEISRLRNGIAELESLLSFQHQPGEQMIFPTLPPIVVFEDDTNDDGS